MNALFRIVLVLMPAAGLTGCVTPAAPRAAPAVPTAVVSPEGVRTIPPRGARDAAALGRSKADVAAALGETLAIGFENGYEVWVYRLARDRKEMPREAAAELVILFAPSGLVSKTRVR